MRGWMDPRLSNTGQEHGGLEIDILLSGAFSYKDAVPLRESHQGLLVESSTSNLENITCLKGCNQEAF
jgi:hypothetical protein